MEASAYCEDIAFMSHALFSIRYIEVTISTFA